MLFAHIISVLKTWTLGPWKLGTLGNLELGTLETWNLKTWKLGTLGTWKLEALGTWKLGTWNLKTCTLGATLFLLLPSCVQHQQLINFNQAEQLQQDFAEDIINATNIPIQPEDLLRIEVNSFDPMAAAPFNPGAGPGGQQQNMQMMAGNQGQGGNYMLELFQGYLVDRDGYIDFPVLGRLRVEGMTIEAAKAMIYGRLQEYLKEPTVNVRYLNLKVTLLGEVNMPGVQRLSNKRVTLLEAIGMAGDLSNYANRNNVLVIREVDGKRSYARLDLQSAEIFTSPYFYLQQNDVIYVEPIQARIATVADPVQRIISYSSAALSIVTLIIALTR